MSAIEVEFYGIARQRANRSSTTLTADKATSLRSVLKQLADEFPELVPDCIEDGKLSSICSANINGDVFVTDLNFLVHPSDRVLIMSADAGG